MQAIHHELNLCGDDTFQANAASSGGQQVNTMAIDEMETCQAIGSQCFDLLS